MPDTRIVCGARCTWWDSIDKVAKTPKSPSGISLPCCPHCGSPLYEFDSIEHWKRQVEKYEAAGHAGYSAFVTWHRGRCFETLEIAREAYLKEEGRTFA